MRVCVLNTSFRQSDAYEKGKTKEYYYYYKIPRFTFKLAYR
jgi:hypothetical protein